jgi:chemotaxis protein methyltransferase CheR
LVYSRLAKRLRKLGLQSFDEYCAFIESDADGAERVQMLAALTTNVTRFFREPHHFEHLRNHVLPELLDAARDGARVRLWSSACSSGEEPYSIALTILDLLPDAGRHDVRILATDIDPNIVNTARAGDYRSEAIAPVAPYLRDRWMSRGAGETWCVNDEVRALVSFKELNLIGDWPMRGQFDAIFCRNVVIYFEEDTQALVWKRMRERLTPAGRLYIGHSERVNVPGFASDGLTVYKLDQGARR